MAEVFALNRGGADWSRAFLGLFVALVPLIVLWAADLEQYFISALFGVLYTWLVDPGGPFGRRIGGLVGFGLAGALLTAVGFAIGANGWVVVMLAAFAVTLLAGLAVKFGVHRFVAALLLNAWFIIALTTASSLDDTRVTSHTWAQVAAWSAGVALWIGVAFVVWLLRHRQDQPRPIAEMPGDTSPKPLTPPAVMFAVLRAVAIAITVGISFGFDLPEADWMPIAALVAMRPSLEQSALVAEQRLIGSFIGAVAAVLILAAIDNTHVLGLVAVIAITVAAAIRFVNYAVYCGGIACGVLVALGIPQSASDITDLYRVLFTFAGVATAVLLMFVAGILGRRSGGRAPAQSP